MSCNSQVYVSVQYCMLGGQGPSNSKSYAKHHALPFGSTACTDLMNFFSTKSFFSLLYELPMQLIDCAASLCWSHLRWTSCHDVYVTHLKCHGCGPGQERAAPLAACTSVTHSAPMTSEAVKNRGYAMLALQS